jgi:hypothetical protein
MMVGCVPCLTLSAAALASAVLNTNTVDCCWLKLVPPVDAWGVVGPPGVPTPPPMEEEPAGDFLLSLPTEWGPPFSSFTTAAAAAAAAAAPVKSIIFYFRCRFQAINHMWSFLDKVTASTSIYKPDVSIIHKSYMYTKKLVITLLTTCIVFPIYVARKLSIY